MSMNLKGKKIVRPRHDPARRHASQAPPDDARADDRIASGLDEAGVPLIEVTHGDGLGGASVNYGFPAHSDEEYLGAVIPLMKQAKVSALLLPGIGTVDHLKMARIRRRHHPRRHPLHRGRRLRAAHHAWRASSDMDTVGFLMMAHMVSPEGLVKQAKLMEGYGANCIYTPTRPATCCPMTSRRASAPCAQH
jgi:4-hydroxy-2-oxovalerate/4-hydroxy-2-oxohexanoate aldolase